ncbi:MAG: redoxin family protein [Candidatus Thermoplasmatota archaeon]|nr:redoxin family protein [Candidatus Thermoplasmatota archaeon]
MLQMNGQEMPKTAIQPTAKRARLKRPVAHFVGRNRTVFAIALTIMILGGIGAVLLISQNRDNGGDGTIAPDFTMKNARDGSTFTLSQHHGKPILIDFMGIDCPSCTKMMPILKQLYDQYGGKLAIVSVDIREDDSESELRSHMDGFGATWAYGIDKDGQIKKAYMEGGYFTDPNDPKQIGIPAFVLIDQNGYVIWREVGLVAKQDFVSNIDAVISGSAQAIAVSGQNLLIFSYLLGLLMFFAPCALPLLPGYMGYYMSKHGDKATVPSSIKNGLVAASGIFAIYLLVGGLTSIVGAAASDIILSIVPFIGGLLIILGILMFFHIQIPTQWFSNLVGKIKSLFVKKNAEDGQQAAAKQKGLFSYGLIYGSASMGCSISVFIGIVAVALMTGPLYAFLALVMFGLGMATLMVAVTVIIGLAKRAIVQKFVGAIGVMNKISALLLVGVGAYLLIESLHIF